MTTNWKFLWSQVLSLGDEFAQLPFFHGGVKRKQLLEVTRVDRVSGKLTVRCFANAKEIHSKYRLPVDKPRLNELYYCNRFDILDSTELPRIAGYCHVEYYKPTSALPINLQHHGAGLQYYFSFQLDENMEISEVEQDLEQRFPPHYSKVRGATKLKVLDLFCGGGAFGRGLQDTGVFECKWAVDIDSMATYTYKANAGHDVLVFNQSVNQFLQDCLQEKDHTPKKGEVDVIIAGYPCQGYSSLNPNRASDQSQSNNSLLASLTSFVEFYEPKFILMENVKNFPRMTETVDGKEQSPFRVLLAFLLSLGYQIRWSYIAAVHHGCPQKRVRFFLWAAAKGEDLPRLPPSSHHGTRTGYSQTSIRLPSTERIPGVVNPYYACFPMRTINDAIGDLPPIGEGQIMCSEFPDHQAIPLPSGHQALANQIPTYPPGCDYRCLVGRRFPNGEPIVLPPWLRRKIDQKAAYGRHFGRVERDGLFETITTRCSPSGFQGKVLHYQENRSLSVREVARGQGFLDSDQIVGRLQDQYRIVGE
ncbi:S-adenosyl-L-methionine-dependent methyltransferase [Basidiobolus meristosporus CBS 931.73]|uniref:DNA (cytosine-5-)-methyltransferase n=1 Tax=Basidiobolus meristosporus CBS 931.73 TaxID=1314790 RepID=A0A1Y1YLD4_9FUNG|nr:S-adenosyl-L-methionine-dependent methyltransferase [Basidiobolus meristosporus CBS 931.73]|eukprot:ORX98566.1 S-adenosyl-L-methionine-dependent methyltransferase [Basidiobolus meristosporus CBS 931.73]